MAIGGDILKRLTAAAVAALTALGATTAILTQLNRDANQLSVQREARSNRAMLLFTVARQPAVATKIAQIYCLTSNQNGDVDAEAQACIDAQLNFGKELEICDTDDTVIGYAAKFTATTKQKQVLSALASQTSGVWLIDSAKGYSNAQAALQERGFKRCPKVVPDDL